MNARLALVLALSACTVRPTPEDTEGAGSDSASAGTSTAGDPTGDPSGDPTAGDPTTGDGLHAGPCRPVDADPTCPMGLVCCSDDPATVGGKIPNYYMDGVNNAEYGLPLFSDNNNALSYWGYCIETGGFQSPLVNGCPVPCNPTWDAGRIAEICGAGECCPFTAVDPAKDCIMVDGRWRSVNGQDIVEKRTGWGAAHATNQDPFAESCQAFSLGDQAALLDCITQLTVADQRGFCLSVACPCTEDLCDMKNDDWVPRCK